MKRTFMAVAILFFLIGQVKGVSASAISPPICFVKAEVINVGSEMRRLDTGEEYESRYIDLKILEVTKKEACLIEKGQVYKAIDNYPGALKKGDRINASISFSDSMGPAGPVSFLQWSMLTYENGSPIRSVNNVIIDYLQSGQEPIHVGN